MCEGGEERRVRKDNIAEFVKLVLKARFEECKE